MRDEVVALEDETDAMVAIGIPVTALVVPGGDPVDDDVAGVGMVETPQHVEKRRLA